MLSLILSQLLRVVSREQMLTVAPASYFVFDLHNLCTTNLHNKQIKLPDFGEVEYSTCSLKRSCITLWGRQECFRIAPHARGIRIVNEPDASM